MISHAKFDDIGSRTVVSPVNSRVALNTLTGPDGEERKIVRAIAQFGEPGRAEFGTYYIAYAATPAVTEEMLERVPRTACWQHRPDPRFLCRPHRWVVFSLPSADFLDDLPGPPGRAAAVSADSSATASQPAASPAGDGSLGIGSLKGQR